MKYLNMPSRNILKTFTDLYEAVRGDKEDFMDEDTFQSQVDQLVECGMIRTGVVHDFTVYSSRQGLQWNEISSLGTIQKSTLLLLIENPKTFFVLQNTQRGKMRIASLEIKKWGQDPKYKVVAFIIVDNDKTLADQSVDGLSKTFGSQPVKLFPLSSNSKTSVEEIRTYIDAYAHVAGYAMPIIALLSNLKQCEKMLKLIHHIHNTVLSGNSVLCYGMIWDEADKTYTQLRERPFTIDGSCVTCQTFTVERTEALYRLGFVTATDGVLLDEDYPECANAYLYPAEISPEDTKYYRALHHPDAITHRVKFTSKHTHNSYALDILEHRVSLDPTDKMSESNRSLYTSKQYFKTPIQLSTGESYFRKIIVNSNGKTEEMVQFAVKCTTLGMYAMVFNGQGSASVKVYRPGHAMESHKTKGKRLNELLFHLYKDLKLHDKPMVILGRRKVDRGLGFHYCPRDSEGLVWTDMILGHIDDKDAAVQKAGRLAGIIANCPQYPGELHFWTDEETEQRIRRHNTLVDVSNLQSGCTVSEAKKKAESITHIIRVNHRVDASQFRVYDSEETMRHVFKRLGISPKVHGKNSDGFIEASLFEASRVLDLLEVIQHVPTCIKSGGGKEGVKIPRRLVSCYKNTIDPLSLVFVLIVAPDISDQMTEVDRLYPSVNIPQEGDYL